MLEVNGNQWIAFSILFRYPLPTGTYFLNTSISDIFSILIHGVILETMDNCLRFWSFTPAPKEYIQSSIDHRKLVTNIAVVVGVKSSLVFLEYMVTLPLGAKASLRLKSTSDKYWANVKPNQIFLCMLKITIGSSLLQDEILSIKIAIWPCMMVQIYSIHSWEMEAEGSEFQTTVDHRVSSRLGTVTSDAPVSKDWNNEVT